MLTHISNRFRIVIALLLFAQVSTVLHAFEHEIAYETECANCAVLNEQELGLIPQQLTLRLISLEETIPPPRLMLRPERHRYLKPASRAPPFA